jgi:hypothetical protein
MKGMQTLEVQHVRETLDCRFVGERWIRIVRGMRWFRRVLIDRAVDLEELFSLAVERFQVVIVERPRG